MSTSALENLSQIEIARRQIAFARGYTTTLLEALADEHWFAMPAGSATHLAWQVGHLAMAQYGLCLFRVRGRRAEDTELMSGKFRKTFSRGSTPDPDPANNPPAAEILDVFHRVHKQSMAELAGYTDADLTEPIDLPYAVHANQLGGLFFCSHHEMIHAGQIGLLRRALGLPPLR